MKKLNTQEFDEYIKSVEKQEIPMKFIISKMKSAIPSVKKKCSMCGYEYEHDEFTIGLAFECENCGIACIARTTRLKNWHEQVIVYSTILHRERVCDVYTRIDMVYNSETNRIDITNDIVAMQVLYNEGYKRTQDYVKELITFCKNNIVYLIDKTPENIEKYPNGHFVYGTSALYGCSHTYRNYDDEMFKYIEITPLLERIPYRRLVENLRLVEAIQKNNADYLMETMINNNILEYVPKKMIKPILDHFNNDNRVEPRGLFEHIRELKNIDELTLENILIEEHRFKGRVAELIFNKNTPKLKKEYFELTTALKVYQKWKNDDFNNCFYRDDITNEVNNLKSTLKRIEMNISNDELNAILEKTQTIKVGDYYVSPPKHLNELALWGKELNNCIGNYTNDVNTGDMIFTVREKPDTPLYAFHILYHNKNISQARGKNNSSVPYGLEKFIEKHIDEIFVKTGLRKG